MTASRRSVLLSTVGISGVALAAGVADAPAADAAAYSVAPGTTLALGGISGTVPLDLSKADTFTCTVTGPTVFSFTYSVATPSPAVTIEPTVIVTQDAVGGHSVSFTNTTWLPAGSGPSFPLAANQATIACFLTPDFGTTVFGQGAPQTGGGFGVYGDGSDGQVVLNGTTPNPYPFLGTGSQPNYYWALRDIFPSELTIAAGCTLQLAGGGTAPFRLLCAGTVTLNGGFLVTVVNTAASGAKAGSNLTTGTLVPGVSSPAGSAAKAVGAAGLNAVGVLGVGSTVAGGAGGANSSGTAGGAGGGANPPAGMQPTGILPRALPGAATMSVTNGAGTIEYFTGGASGGAGAGDGTNAGGAGGPGGNPLFVAARAIVNNGTVKASGGSGGAAAGGNAGGGGGGQGGPIMLISGSISGTGTFVSAGGNGGPGAGSGAAGKAGGSGWIVQVAN